MKILLAFVLFFQSQLIYAKHHEDVATKLSAEYGEKMQDAILSVDGEKSAIYVLSSQTSNNDMASKLKELFPRMYQMQNQFFGASTIVLSPFKSPVCHDCENFPANSKALLEKLTVVTQIKIAEDHFLMMIGSGSQYSTLIQPPKQLKIPQSKKWLRELDPAQFHTMNIYFDEMSVETASVNLNVSMNSLKEFVSYSLDQKFECHEDICKSNNKLGELTEFRQMNENLVAGFFYKVRFYESKKGEK